MQTLSEIRTLLAERGLAPRHRLGQHFLHDHNQLRKLVEAAAIEPGQLVLEVGPGTGTLTETLLEAGAEVVACELDDGLASLIEERLGDRVLLVRGDCLDRGRVLNPRVAEALGDRPFTLVSNLPYQAASPLIVTLLLHGHPRCLGQHVTVQREVADRLMAAPASKAYGPLGIIVQALASVRRIAVVKPGSFWPPPKVDSAMVSIVPIESPGVDAPLDLARFVTKLFTRRRKQLGTALGRDRDWPAGIRPDQRPEQLTVTQIVELWKHERG
ncbi:MAG: 16S rRNA (adenine(1518)-N(6)/adenine(1519)-N(6))-dimethyltransferase RsmA [Planctomycetota bacterium]|jgi:16S rRNA (adenine1518-N6/adenine1519-N6)-dimethyltransferase